MQWLDWREEIVERGFRYCQAGRAEGTDCEELARTDWEVQGWGAEAKQRIEDWDSPQGGAAYLSDCAETWVLLQFLGEADTRSSESLSYPEELQYRGPIAGSCSLPILASFDTVGQGAARSDRTCQERPLRIDANKILGRLREQRHAIFDPMHLSFLQLGDPQRSDPSPS